MSADLLAAVNARIDALVKRIDELAAAPAADPVPASEPKRRRGRPPKAVTAGTAAAPTRTRRPRTPRVSGARSRVALHDEIAAVIAERGPQTATELAAAIAERGRYHAPRSARPLDAAIVNARVSNPKYRPRFVRRARRIGLAEPEVAAE
jgi:hypothetical protein